MAVLAFLCCSLPMPATAQTLRGKVVDKQSREPLAGTYVLLSHAGKEQVTETDSAGNFRIRVAVPGRYQVHTSRIGYAGWHKEELLLQTGKETVLPIELEPVPQQLTGVEIRNLPPLQPRAYSGTHNFSTEKTQRVAAAYYDPARLATAYPGVVGTDDQANNLSVRGHSPAGILWRLQGLNIVNPNHLANAGTFSDRATPTGGGVTILSAQLLSYSKLLTGNFPVGYGNTISGVMDMRLRQGNNHLPEHTFDASLLGIDLATEGPISRTQGSSYLVNYRYSTVGLLSAAGVNFGNEAITYHDLSFHIGLPTKRAGDFSIFGLGGQSRNTFTSPVNQADWQTEKDRHNIRFRSGMFALGSTYERRLSSRLGLQSAAVFSKLENTRTDQFSSLLPAPPARLLAYDRQQEQLLSGRASLHYRLRENVQLQAGLVSDVRQAEGLTQPAPDTLVNSQISYTLWQPFVSGTWQLGPKLTLEAGLQYLYATYFRAKHFQPQASLQYHLTTEQSVRFSAGHYGQLPAAGLLLGNAQAAASDLRFLQSTQVALSYLRQLTGSWKLKTELYYQRQRQVTEVHHATGVFSALNYLNEPVTGTLSSTGKGRNYGLEVSFEKPLWNRYYLLLTGTLYRALYTSGNQQEQSTRLNGRFASGLAAGKEWHWKSASGKYREAGLHLRTTYRGGLRDSPIDLARSEELQQTGYVQPHTYSVRLPNYFRTDLRLSLRTNRTRSTRLWYLDIQNVTSYQNVAYHYYDALQGKILTRYQLGIIPVLGYRVEF